MRKAIDRREVSENRWTHTEATFSKVAATRGVSGLAVMS